LKATYLGSDPNIIWVNTRASDALSDLVLIAVDSSAIEQLVADFESGFDGLFDFASFSLPCA
jgi:CMP-2-keto-3-deoxyoctulosonic acid synthetase